MQIESIEIEIDITEARATLDLAISTILQQWGKPLHWAITAVDLITFFAIAKKVRQPNI
jgi:hypothetical protein